MRLHIGSGSVFLLGWLNIDVHTPHTYLASDRPDLVERWATKEDDYYSRHTDTDKLIGFQSPLEQEYVCDKYGDFTHLPVANSSVTEVLARQSFEHLGYTEARAALAQIEAVLEPEGILRLDVPDHAETVRLLRETGDDFYARHLYGPRRDAYGYHVMSYTRDALIALVTSCGFVYQFEEPNIHPYPAFCLRFVKSALPAPHTYIPIPCELDASATFMDIGPGAYPHPRANIYVDVEPTNLKRLKLGAHQRVVIADLADPVQWCGFKDKAIDYIWMSHVLEHVEDIHVALSILSRIGKRGTIIVPSAIKEALFNFHEPQHKWMILPRPNHAPPVFVRRNGQFDKIIDREMQHVMYRFLQSGPNNHQDGHTARNWYQANERNLDVVIHWEGEAKVMVVE